MDPEDYAKLLELLEQRSKLISQLHIDFDQLWPKLFPHIQSKDLYTFAYEWFRAGYELAESRKGR